MKEEKTRFMDQLKDSSHQILELKKEVKNLDQINQELKKKVEETDISKFIINNDKRCKFYTGIDSYEKLIALFDFIEKSAPKPHPLEVLTHFQQFVLTLVKLRLNLRLEDLGHRFNIAKSTVSKYVHIWVTGMYIKYSYQHFYFGRVNEKEKLHFLWFFVNILSAASQLLIALKFLCSDLPNSKSALQPFHPTNITTQSNT